MPEEPKEPIVFKCEPAMWAALKSGTKSWDARRYDMREDRIYRLSFGRWITTHDAMSDANRENWDSIPDEARPKEMVKMMDELLWIPEEKFIHFKNIDTGENLIFKYKAMMFANWAPGWCFLILGDRQ